MLLKRQAALNDTVYVVKMSWSAKAGPVRSARGPARDDGPVVQKCRRDCGRRGWMDVVRVSFQSRRFRCGRKTRDCGCTMELQGEVKVQGGR